MEGDLIRCFRCGAANRAGARFCARCGQPLGRTCPRCGALVSVPAARFCGQCGAALEVEAPVPPPEVTAAASGLPPEPEGLKAPGAAPGIPPSAKDLRAPPVKRPVGAPGRVRRLW